MATLKIPDLEEEVIQRLKEQAKRNGRSLNDEAIAILKIAALSYKVDEAMDDGKSAQEE